MLDAPAPDLVPPAHLWVPPRADTYGADAVDLAGVCGLQLEPEQALAIDSIMSVRDDGRWAALEAGVVVPRQNGKSVGVLMPVALAAAVFEPDQLVVWSAHRYKTSQEAFLAMLKLYRTSPELERHVRRPTYANGEESFEFHNGSRIIFIARSQASGRGLSGDLVILDEALFLTPEMMGALMPTLSARPNPQVVYASSAGLATSDVLVDVRDRGRSGDDPSLVWVEWCAPEGGCASDDCDHHRDSEGCALDDRAKWRAANPALGRRISEDYVAAERRSLKPAEFARERLGWWDSRTVGGLFHMPSWYKLQDDDSTPGGTVSMAVHVTPDRRAASIGVGSLRGDGRLHVEVAEHREGVSWVVPWLVERCEMHADIAGVVLAGSMAAGSLAPDLEHLPGFRALSSTDARRACGSFYDAVVEGTLAHLPNPDLGDAVKAAARSSERGEWVFAADSDVDLSPLYAVALAAWVARAEADYDIDASIF